MGLAFVERLMSGILDYARDHGDWSFARVPEALSPSIDWLVEWPGDAAFALITNERDAGLARALKIPIVNLAGHLQDAGVPSVTVDHRAIGVMAAGHLIERCFKRFGYYGVEGKSYSDERLSGFSQAVAESGGFCDVLLVGNFEARPVPWVDQQEELESWLKGLVPPVGVMASTDLRAGMVVDACQRLGLRVPEDVAVIGVDNDPVACEFRDPQLSSVSRNDHRVGYEAAKLLDDLVHGRTGVGTSIRIAPDLVVSRKSTQVMAVEDREVAEVLHLMEEMLDQPFGVEVLMANRQISRRRLEQRFKACLGCGPAEYLNRKRVERAKVILLEDGHCSLTDVSVACGFTELRRFREVFRRFTGMSPAEFRDGGGD